MPDYFDAAARPGRRERDGPAWLTVLLTAAVVGAAVAIAEKYAAHEAHWGSPCLGQALPVVRTPLGQWHTFCLHSRIHMRTYSRRLRFMYWCSMDWIGSRS